MRLNWFHGHQDNRQLPLPLSVKQLLQQAVPCCQHQLISNISHVSSASLHAVLALRDTWCAVQVVLWRHDALRPVLLVRCPIKRAQLLTGVRNPCCVTAGKQTSKGSRSLQGVPEICKSKPRRHCHQLPVSLATCGLLFVTVSTLYQDGMVSSVSLIEVGSLLSAFRRVPCSHKPTENLGPIGFPSGWPGSSW